MRDYSIYATSGNLLKPPAKSFDVLAADPTTATGVGLKPSVFAGRKTAPDQPVLLARPIQNSPFEAGGEAACGGVGSARIGQI